MYFSFASKDKGSCNVSTCKFIRFPLNSYTFHALIRFFTPQFSKKRTILPRKTSTVLLWDGVHGTPIM